jgi:methionyl aminopeptidase
MRFSRDRDAVLVRPSIARSEFCTKLADRRDPSKGAAQKQMSNVDVNRTASRDGKIPLHGPEAFAAMRKAGRLAAEALDMLVPLVQPGTTTERIDELILDFALSHGAIPATLNYRGYRYSCCTSINHVVCHGMPNAKPLKDGDIVNIDVTLIVDGWHGDTSRMYPVGNVSRRSDRLMQVTYESLMRGIAAVKPGATTGDIGAAIQKYAEGERCSVVRDFCGHGLGRVFHDRPNILHYGEPGEGVILEPGMLFTIEPMINLGKPHVKILADGWTAVTRDRELSAQFEHTVGVTDTGVEIFTTSPAGFDCPPYRLDKAA